MNNSQQNKVLLNEMKKMLDEQESQLGFPIQSKLTQARFHAIDRGFLNSSHSVYNKQFVQNKLGVASLVLAMIVSLGLFASYSSTYSHTFNPLQISSPVPQNQNKMRTVESSEDTKEEVDIYDWLYEQYG